MAYPFANFHVAMRALIGDQGSLANGYDYADEQLNGGIASVINMGFVPCVDIAADGVSLESPPPNRSTWAYLAAKAAHLLVGGATPTSFRTRALSITVEASGRRDTLSHLEAMLSEIDSSGSVCSLDGDITHRGLVDVVNDAVTSTVVLARPRAFARQAILARDQTVDFAPPTL